MSGHQIRLQAIAKRLAAEPENNDPLFDDLRFLYQQHEKISRQFLKVAHISDLLQEKLERERSELREAREAAESANMAKSRFLANMSHEIRSPIACIIGALEILLRQETDSSRQDLLSMASESANSLLKIINDILDLSKVEAGKMTLTPETFDPVELLERLAALHRMSAQEKQITFTLNLDPSLPTTLYGAQLRLEQVLRNLVGNAIKFTPKRGMVTLSAHAHTEREATLVTFAVEDTGIGIPTESLQEIFNTFVQVESNYLGKSTGTGLGLPIAKALAELMGGTISVTSNVGRGTCFQLVVPFYEPTGANEKNGLLPTKPPAVIPPLRILIAEDMPLNFEYISFLLQEEKHSITRAADGETACALFRENTFDLILMDIQMPILDGLEATAAIRKYEKEQGMTPIPIVALTAYAMEEDIAHFLSVGMNAHLAKPVRKVDLQRTLGVLFGAEALNQEPLACSRPETGDFASKAVFNWKWISDNFEGNFELWHSMLERFFQETYPELAQILEQAIANDNQEDISLQLHRLKGLVGLFQAPQTFEKVHALEQKARRGQPMTLCELEAIQRELAYMRQVASHWQELHRTQA